MPINLNTADWKVQGGSNNATTTPTIDRPDNLAEDDAWVIFLILRTGDTDPAPTPPTGFSLITSTYVSGFWNADVFAYQKLAGTSEPATVDFTLADSLRWGSVSMRFDGDIDIANLIGNFSSVGTDGTETQTSISTPSITGSNGNLLVGLWGFASDNNNQTDPVTEPGSMTKRAEIIRTSTAGVNAAVATEVLAADGATGTRDWAWTDGGGPAALMFEINAVSGFSLDVTTVNGTVTKNPDKELYDPGEVVELTANPDPGWKFDGWTGDVPE